MPFIRLTEKSNNYIQLGVNRDPRKPQGARNNKDTQAEGMALSTHTDRKLETSGEQDTAEHN